MRLKFINSFGERFDDVDNFEKALRSCSNEKYVFEGLNHRQALGVPGAFSPQELDELYRNKNSKLIKFYDEVSKACEGGDVFVVHHENVYHPEFIKKLSESIYTVLYTSDDPESSYKSSQPYVWAFDHILCYSVYYDVNTLMVDKLRQWGARRANHKPHGFHLHKCNINIQEKELFSIVRDVDVLYVGGAYNKVSDLLKVKKAFGKRFKLYGDWGGIGPLLGLYKRHGFFPPVRPLPEKDFVRTYQRSLIGLNMHMSFGPSNLRMWDLPINGVLQVTDNPIGTSNLFDVGSEVCCYNNGDIDRAIEIIDYYLSNDDERIEIARAGYRKAKAEYSFQKSWWKIIPEIELGIMEKKNHKYDLFCIKV